LAELGDGTYGRVFFAEDRLTGQKVAIKMIEDALTNEVNAKYASRELKLLRLISSLDKSIYATKLHDVILPKQKHSTSIFLVQEYFGTDLRNLMTKFTDV